MDSKKVRRLGQRRRAVARSCTVSVYLTEREFAEVKRKAAREGLTAAAWTRRIVSEEMERRRELRRRRQGV